MKPMNKKTFMVAITTFAFLISLATGMQLEFVRGSSLSNNDISQIKLPVVTFSIENNTVLSKVQNLSLALFAYMPVPGNLQLAPFLDSISFTASWRNETIDLSKWTPNNPGVDHGYFVRQDFSYIENLTNVPQGHQHLEVTAVGRLWDIFGNDSYYFTDSYSLEFTVAVPPSISLLSVENITYNSSTIPLIFTVSEGSSWLGFSLDNQANVTINGNSTLTGLTEGNHSLVIYANDTLGNTGKSETVFFNIELPMPSPSPTIEPSPSPSVPEFQNWIILPLMAVAATMIVYFKKGERN
jgi:hypothetical protein